MEGLRNALITARARKLARDWRDAAEALLALLRDETELGCVPPAAAWELVRGLTDAAQTAEAAVKRARGHPLPPGARRVTGQLLYALGEVRDALERYVEPAVERRFGPDPRR